ncbi:RNA helicase [Aphelenchoides bicaudatus]|nr:RNA helicase [Aphelenchoides bicaudatus]
MFFGKLIVLPLYSVLSQEEQQEIFNPVPVNYLGMPLARKCIVSTNIAETSLTIDGVHYIVDSGRCEQKRFLPKDRVDQFTVEPISKASASQRAGRAGRTAGGKCFRMYTELFYNKMEEYSVPEILKCNFANVALLLKRLGVSDLNNFNYMVSPKPEAIQHATDLLRHLGALDQNYSITPLGVLMAEFPVDPPLAKMLIMASRKYRCANEILTLVSVLSAPPIFSRPRKKATEADQKHAIFVHPDGDHLTIINVFNAYAEIMLNTKKDPENEKFDWCLENFFRFESLQQAEKIRSQLYHSMYTSQLDCASLDLKHKDYSINIRKCVLEGFFTQLNRLCLNYSLKDSESVRVLIHQTSQMRNTPPQWLVYNELNRMERSNVMRVVSSINVQWLFEVAPHYFSDLNSWPAGLVKERLLSAKAEFDLFPFEKTLTLN